MAYIFCGASISMIVSLSESWLVLVVYTFSLLYLIDLHPVDTNVSEFTTDAYQAEIIRHLANKPEMGWYDRSNHPTEQSGSRVPLDVSLPIRRQVGLINCIRTRTLGWKPNGFITAILLLLSSQPQSQTRRRYSPSPKRHTPTDYCTSIMIASTCIFTNPTPSYNRHAIPSTPTSL